MASGSKQPAAAADKSILTTVLTLEGHTEAIPSICYFPDGEHIASGSYDKTARRWDLQTGKEIEEVRDIWEQEVDAVVVSRDGRWIITAGGDSDDCGELKAHDIETGIAKTFHGHSDRINCIDISADSTLLASGAEDRTIRIWNLNTSELVAGPFKSADKVGAIRFSLDSKMLAAKSCAAKCLEVWDVQAQKLNIRLGKYDRRRPPELDAPVFWTMKDKSIIAAFSFMDEKTGPIYEFDPSTLQTIGAPFEGHTDTISGLALSFDCVLLASASSDQTIKLWVSESRQLLASFSVQRLRYLILSPDSSQLAYTTHDDTKIHVCDTPPDILATLQPGQLTRISAPHVFYLPEAILVDLTKDKAHPVAGGGFGVIQKIILDMDGRPIKLVTVKTIRMHPDQLLDAKNVKRIKRELGVWRRLSHAQITPLLGYTSGFGPLTTIVTPFEAMLRDLTGYITKDKLHPVAGGGFGDIWKCTYHMNGRPIKVAVKSLRMCAAYQVDAARMKMNKRLRRELTICANLKHRNILPVFGYTYSFGPFMAIVSPWAENGDLTAYLKCEGKTLADVRRFQILSDTIAGLRYLHDNRVIHGDVTGLNVFILNDGTACIADFGLSLMYTEVMSASQAPWTSTPIQGNVPWMAPELLVGREDGSQVRPSEQSDIYSFGGIMLQVLTNKIPYYYIPHKPAIIVSIAKSEKPSRSRYPVIPDKYWQFMERCWSTVPQDRPLTEEVEREIRDEFTRCLD